MNIDVDKESSLTVVPFTEAKLQLSRSEMYWLEIGENIGGLLVSLKNRCSLIMRPVSKAHS